MKKLIAITCVFSVITACLCACSAKNEQETAASEITSESTTAAVETTIEDLETTFNEYETRKVYEGLEKDNSSLYPYEIASYTSNYKVSEKERTENLKTAAQTLDYIKIPDGQTFSFNQTVGKRTLTGGYSTAKVIENDEFVDGLGGGVCQVSSTIFEAALYANMEIVERTNHTLAISYVPMGGDATVQWNSRDFKFKNTLGTDIMMTISCNNGKLTCKLWSKDKISIGNIKVDITKNGDKYILTRTVNGVQNYKTTSVYK